MAERPIPLSGEGRLRPLTAMGLSLLLHGAALSAALAAVIGQPSPDEIVVPITLTMEDESTNSPPESNVQPSQPLSSPPPQTSRPQTPHPTPRPIRQPAARHQDIVTPSLVPSPDSNKMTDVVSNSVPPSASSSASETGDVAAADGPAPFQSASYHLGQAETPAPTYPMSARRKGHEGTVVVRLNVAEDGSPKAVSVIDSSGDFALDEAAMETLKRWRLKPALRHGLPVESIIDVPIRFLLN